MRQPLGGFEPRCDPYALGGQDFGGWSQGSFAALAQEQDLGARCQCVGSVMRGHDGLHAIFSQPQLQPFEKRIARCAVERGKRLIKKQKPRRGCERARERYALRFTAGEVPRVTHGEIRCAGEGEHLCDARCSSLRVEMVQAIGNIRRDREVREERGLLGNERGRTVAGREMQTGSGLGHHTPIEGNAATRGAVETGEQTEQCALARAGRSEDHGPFGEKGALHLKVEAAAA